MATLSFPFQLGLNPEALTAFPPAKTIERRLSDMPAYYQDQDAVAQRSADNPLIYRFWEIENHDAPRGLSVGITTIFPGTIGREFFMTKGHFHSNDGDEIYLTLRGQGKLLLFTRDGDVQTLDMLPGSLCYIPTAYAHRTVNTGSEEFTFAAFWPPDIHHDYETIVRSGFPQLVLQGENGAEIARNPKFSENA